MDIADLEESSRGERVMVEAVIAQKSPAVGRTVKQSRFRTTYNASIIAIHRNGERVQGGLGDVTIQVRYVS